MVVILRPVALMVKVSFLHCVVVPLQIPKCVYVCVSAYINQSLYR